MKRTLILPACLLITIGLSSLPALHHSAPPIPPAPTPVASALPANATALTTPYVQTAYISSTDGLILIRQSKEPYACTPGSDGRLFMNARAEICICDGAAKVWRVANTDKSCTGKTAP
jgi:hypothetical protein